MSRLGLLAAALAACGTDTDDRPLTLPYITEAILAPSCGVAECHSTFKQEVGDVFDTVKGARASIVNNGLIVIPDDEADPSRARIVVAVTIGLPSRIGEGPGPIRMPYDAPMPVRDIELIKKWIAAGAPGAQCVPEQGNVCVVDKLTACDSSGNLGAVIQTCPPGTCRGGMCQ